MALTPEQFRRAEAVFFAAAQRPLAERIAFVERTCADDFTVRDEVLAMLRHDEVPDSALRSAALADVLRDQAAALLAAQEKDFLAERIGSYKLLALLGEGGMGTVYLAEQERPLQRRVALKLIKRGMDTHEVLARFEAERQALARMNHPNVARVLDAGATPDGRPYFVMEYVEGVPLTRHCDRNKLSLRARLALFIQICHAVQHAHQKALLHRDLKPSNILVETVDGRAAPKIIDFGIAKALEQPLIVAAPFTEVGQLIGTPAYMSPEQADPEGRDIDTRSDIYALGVLLYELLTGMLPFESRGGHRELLWQIREIEPLRPSARLHALLTNPVSLGEQVAPQTDVMTKTAAEKPPDASDSADGLSAKNSISMSTVVYAGVAVIAEQRGADPKTLWRQLRGDLDWIVMKCLEKDRAQRYETANALALEIQRHLNSEPVLAGPPSVKYRLQKFVRRHRGAVLAGVMVAAAVLLGLIGSAGGLMWALRERDRAVRREQETKLAAAFQGALLRDVNIEAMGRGILERLRGQVAAGLEREWIGEPPRPRTRAEIEAGLAAFDAAARPANPADIARQVLDEHVLRRAVTALKQQFVEQPAIQAVILESIGLTYQSLGLYDAAEPLCRELFALRRSLSGGDHPDTLTALHNLGSLLQAQGRLSEAEDCLRQAVAGRRHALGRDHPHTLISVNDLGVVLRAQNKLAAAEPYIRESLNYSRRTLGNDHPDTLTSIYNLGVLLQAQNKLPEAEVCLREALAGRRHARGVDPADLVSSIGKLGDLLAQRNNWGEAEQYMLEAVQRGREILGENHSITLTAINNLGNLLQNQGRFAAAEPYCREALEGYRRVLGGDNVSTLVAVNNMGTLLRKRNKPADAEPYYREAVVGFQRRLGKDNLYVGNARLNLGGTLASLARFTEAEQELLEAERILSRAEGVPSQRIRESMEVLITLYEQRQVAEPGRGYDQKAAEWRGKLEQWRTATQSAAVPP